MLASLWTGLRSKILLRTQRGFFRPQRPASSSSSPVAYQQDLPPTGGYADYDWGRIPQKPYMGATKQFLLVVFMTITGKLMMELDRKRWRGEKLEMLDAKVALMPMLLAERDRLYLRRIRRNREEEERIMKNVPGWEVGKWFDEPVYKTVPKDHWIDPTPFEYWVHCEAFEFEKWYHWWFTA
ncbi:hypothetical protein RvY_18883 [Ramazzottius varieornatus]|uniref:NADH dehydrogenase [ubiquinone] 1 alpha subcomplex subunit 13 n=1 Tax=Ramazzottius varieornatus TaxID=947166 RepID=A0A1D1WBV9_RAMVA|nr:hypothetical protein RvY_18883 [Ramazzottius varieornatus]